MTTRNAHGRPAETGGAPASSDGLAGAALAGGIVGGLVGGAVFYTQAVLHLTFVGSIAGMGGMPAAFGVWMGFAVAFGLLFGGIARPATDYYTAGMTWSTARLGPFRKLAGPIASTGGVGLVYGLVLGGVVGFVGIPAAVGADVPAVKTNVLVGYAAFGLVSGLTYGLARDGWLPVPSFSFIGSRVRAAAFAPLVAGVLSGAVVYSQQPVYLRYLSTIVDIGTPTGGLAIWVGVTFALGLVFAVVAAGHAARGNSTTGYGLVYGIVLAVFVGLLAIPAAVTAGTQWELGFQDVGGAALGAWVVYGLVLGSTFGKVVNARPLRPAFLVGRTRATVIASLVAGAASGALMLAQAPLYLQLVGALAGFSGSPPLGFGIWLTVAIPLGVGFAVFPARRIERADTHGQTGFKVGLLYGLLLSVVGVFLMPPILSSATPFTLVAPHTNGAVLAAYLLFGPVLGVSYEAISGPSRVTPAFLQGRGAPVVGGATVGGAAGAVVANALTTGGVYFLTLGTVVDSPSLTTGLGIWFGLLFLLALAFVPLAARAVEYRVGIPRGLAVGVVYGAVLTGVVGVVAVPALVRAGGTALALPHTNSVIAGYFVFGTVFGGAYGHLRKQTISNEEFPTSTAIGTSGQRAIVFGSLFGGAVGGLVVHHMVGPVAMRYFGALVGYGGSMEIGWAVWLGLSLILGMTFAVAVGPRLSRYAHSMDQVTERDEDLDAVFGDFLDLAPVTTAATLAGVVYGVVLAIAVGAIGVPLAVNTMTPFGMFVPELQPFFLLAFVVYGLVMGLGYGVVKEF
ncbi:hypothetical protein [Natronomonas amylolytica]|uniref:hypothetical protein n=1 Tax=Natronomonas amylolytica TaxID=3108498 RepID=UPI00300849E7